MCGLIGFFLGPILSCIAIGMGKPGGAGRLLGVIGLVLWTLGVLFFFLANRPVNQYGN